MIENLKAEIYASSAPSICPSIYFNYNIKIKKLLQKNTKNLHRKFNPRFSIFLTQILKGYPIN